MKLRTDTLIAVALFCAYLALLLATCGSLGFTRDEGFYFASARAYESWFGLLCRDPSRALSPAIVDRYWAVNHEHPSLIKSLFALSHHFLYRLFDQESTSFRLPAMLLSSLAVSVTFAWGRRVLGRAGALVAALSFAFLPHVFFHAHLACFDLPVCAMWLVTSYAYVRSLEAPRFTWALGAALLYGLLLDTKHNSWIFPFVLALHFALTRGLPLLRDLRSRGPWWRQLPLAWLGMLLVAPLVFYALWPWIWHDTIARLRDYVAFHTGHEYYNMEFLGRTYWQPPMPRAYAWLMTAATVPLVTLTLAAAGLAFAYKSTKNRDDYVFWAASILASYAPWLSSNTPIFGGTKHWMTAYPFLCLFAGAGFNCVVRAVRDYPLRFLPPRFVPLRFLSPLALPTLCAACILAGPIVMTLHAHPFGLSAYTPLVGGAPGAASLGLNRTFWGYTTQNLAPFINARAPRRATVYVHDTALQSFTMFQADRRLRRDLHGSLDIAASDIALYHHEPHMSRVEQQIWVAYGTVAPEAIATFDGVPVAWAYARKTGK